MDTNFDYSSEMKDVEQSGTAEVIGGRGGEGRMPASIQQTPKGPFLSLNVECCAKKISGYCLLLWLTLEKPLTIGTVRQVAIMVMDVICSMCIDEGTIGEAC